MDFTQTGSSCFADSYEEIREGRYAKPPANDRQAERPAILIPKDDPPAIMIICVVGRELGWWQYNNNKWMQARYS